MCEREILTRLTVIHRHFRTFAPLIVKSLFNETKIL
jgi:hypothetical protein